MTLCMLTVTMARLDRKIKIVELAMRVERSMRKDLPDKFQHHSERETELLWQLVQLKNNMRKLHQQGFSMLEKALAAGG